MEEEPATELDLSCFSGNLRRDDRDNARNCWKISEGNNFRVRSKQFCFDKSKVLSCFSVLLGSLLMSICSYFFVANCVDSCR